MTLNRFTLEYLYTWSSGKWTRRVPWQSDVGHKVLLQITQAEGLWRCSYFKRLNYTCHSLQATGHQVKTLWLLLCKFQIKSPNKGDAGKWHKGLGFKCEHMLRRHPCRNKNCSCLVSLDSERSFCVSRCNGIQGWSPALWHIGHPVCPRKAIKSLQPALTLPPGTGLCKSSLAFARMIKKGPRLYPSVEVFNRGTGGWRKVFLHSTYKN